MNLYIMSRGRAGRTTTQKWIPKSWQNRTFFIVPIGEVNDYIRFNKDVGVLPAPTTVTNYSQKVQYILDGEFLDKHPKAVILDDDLVFSEKSDPSRPTSLISVKDPERLVRLYEYMEALLDHFALVGVHPRQNGNLAKTPHTQNGRIICIQAINRRMIGNVKVDQQPILADVVLNCTLLARGQPNALITTFFQDHGPCQAPGGCSLYRTPDMQRAAVEYLASRFPAYVKVVERHPKVAKWMGDTRYDYTCQWKLLYEAGVAYSKGGAKVDMELP